MAQRTAVELGLHLLGPVELIVGQSSDGPNVVNVGTHKQRAVLALLALQVGEVVSRDVVIDRLWGTQAPTSAVFTVRSLVSRLRRVLQSADGAFTVETKDPGWVLRADPERIDAGRFAALLVAARAAQSRGEPAAAAATLRQALDLWRGDALADVVGAGYLAAEATHLNETRLQAVEDLAEAELAAGWAADALAHLESHVAAHPLRERAWGQLMVALYHLGRQVDALRAYQRLRDLLDHEFGLEPTPALTDLQARILRHDPGLAPRATALGGTEPPRSAPADPADSAHIRSGALIADVAPDPGAHLGERTRFVGRETELALLSDLLRRARSGTGGILLVGGEPGIGKTRLVDEASAEAAGAGMRVLVGHSYEMAGASPYVAFVEILETALAAAPDAEAFVAEVLADAAPEIARLVPHLRRRFPDLPPPLDLPPAQERLYLFRCLADVLARLAAARPTLVVLDDLQWSDEPTLLFLEHLAPQLAGLPLAVVATYRHAEVAGPLGHTLEELHRHRLAQRVDLAPLSPAEVGDLVAALAGHVPPVALAESLHAATEGNAFYLEEVYRDLMEQGRLLDPTGRFRTVDVAAVGVPEGVRLVTGRRLERLSGPTRALLTAVAVTGRVFTFELLQALGDLDDDLLLDAVDEAEAACVIVPGGGDDDYLFAHELVRQTLTGALSSPRRRRAHLRAAEAMMAVFDTDPAERAAEIAHHLVQAGGAADRALVLRWSLLAGRRALDTSAFEEAATHLERAARLIDAASGRERGDLFAALGEARRSLGRPDAALEAWDRARQEYEVAGDADAVGRVSVQMGSSLLYRARLGEAERVARQGLAAMGDADGAERARLLSLLGFALACAGDADGADACFEEALAAAVAAGSDLATGFVEADRSQADHALMRARSGAEAGRRAAAALAPHGERWATALALWPAAWNLVCLGRFAESAQMLEEHLAVDRLVAHPSLVMERRAAGPREFYRTGDVAALFDSIAAEIELIERLMGGAWISWSYSWMGTAHFLRGDWDHAHAWFRKGVETLPGSAWDGWCTASEFLYLAYAGRTAEALALYAEHRPRLGEPARPTTTGTWGLLLAFTEGLFILGHHDEPAGWYDLVVEAGQTHGVVVAPYAPGQLLNRVAGIAATAAGDHETAERHFRAALHQADELPHQFERYETRRFYARMLASRADPGDADHARTLLVDAERGFTRLRMPRHAEMAADDHRFLG